MLSLRAGLLAIGLMISLALPMLATDTGVISDFVVLVDTNQTFYQAGDTIVIDVFTFLNGVAIPATLQSVILTVSTPNGDELRVITPAFRAIGSGRFVAQGIAQGSGVRKVDVVATYQVNNIVLTGIGYESYLVDAQVSQPGFFVDIEFIDLPVNPTVCDQIKITLTVNRVAFVRFFQQMPDGSFRDILVPGWLKPGSRWIKFEPNKFNAGLIVFKVIAKDQHGNEVMDDLSIFLPNC